MIATVGSALDQAPVGGGRVRFTVVSPTHQSLGVTNPNARGTAELKTNRLVLGQTYVVQAHLRRPECPLRTEPRPAGGHGRRLVRGLAEDHGPPVFRLPGTPVAFIITALDHAGHKVPGYTGTVQFVSPTDHSAKFGTKTYTFTAADQGAHAFPDGVTFHKGGRPRSSRSAR